MLNRIQTSQSATLVAALTVLIAAAVFAADVPTRHDEELVIVTATVTAIDLKTRELTLKGPLGNSDTVIVEPTVKRLNEIKVGDTIKAEFHRSFVAELREPTAAEREKPLTVVEAGGRADKTSAPGAAGVRKIKAVVTIEAIDRPAKTITVKGPRGRYVTAQVADPSILEKVQLGQSIVITYTEAVAVSVEKANSKRE